MIDKQKSNYFPALTGVRACAAYMVYWFHCTPFPPGTRPWRILHEGHIGVTVFFVLSGFLICSRYLDRIELSRHWLRRYFQNRFARVYPMYFLFTTLSFLFARQLGMGYDTSGQWANFSQAEKALALGLNYTLLRGFFEHFFYTGVPTGWTLTVEECFYLAAPVLLLGLVHARHRYAQLVAYGVAILSIGFLLVAILPHTYGLFNTYQFMLRYTFFGRCWEFLCGIGLALFIKQQVKPRALGFTWLSLGLIALLVFALTQQLAPGEVDVSTSHLTGIAINNLLLPFAIAMLFYGLIFEDTWLKRLLSTPTLQLLGKSSYVFYLIHWSFITVALLEYVTTSYYVIFLVMIVLSIVIFYFLEEPAHRKIAGFRNKKG